MSSSPDPRLLGRRDSWDGVRAVVAGFGVSGFAAADNLTHLGASVVALDESEAGDRPEKAELLSLFGADIRLGAGTTAVLPDDVDVLVTSPGWSPSAPLLAQAVARGIPVWGEVELAWRLRDPEHQTPWLAVTGTNGKTTTVQMLDAILRRSGLRSVACGNVGLPIVEAVMDPVPYDVLAVELSSFQLHYTESMAAESAVVLNVAEDHLDWYSGPTGWPSTPPTRARIYDRVERACVYNVADSATEQMVRDADVMEGARAIGFTLGTPAVGMLGLVDDILADRAFVEERATSAAELCTIADLASPAPHFIANALAAAHWLGRTACPRWQSATACATSGPTGTGSPRSRPSGECATWTTRRPPTRTPPRRPCRPTNRWSGWPGGWPRALRSTPSWRPAGPGCGGSC